MNDSGSSLINLRPSPDTVIISCDCTVMVTSRDGLVHHKTANGLFTHRSRMLSRYEYLVDDQPLKPVTVSAIRQDESLAYYIQHAGSPSSDQTATIDTLELKVHRRVRSNGLKDHLELTNYSQNTISFEFALKIDADFVDQSEVISDKNPPQRGTVRTRLDQPSVRVFKLTFDYQAIHRYHQQSELGTSQFNRSSEITVQCSDGKIRYLHEAIRVEIRLLPHQSKDIRVQVRPIYTAGKIRGPFENVGVYESHANSAAKQSEIELTEIVTPGRNAMAISALKTISRAANDLKALRLHDLDVTGGWVPAAGVPMYIGFFGRDAMIAGMHSLMLGPEMLRGALTQLAVWQATETDDWRDEQPGRMLHQAEIGPLAVLNYTPFRRYYGTITTPALFGWALRLLWRWTANREDVERFIEPALRAVQWLDEFCTSDCGGFYSYRKRSAKGLKNQAWKDSGEAIVDENGLQVADPIATCECQAYVYASKLHAAELLQYLNRAEEAKALIDQAEELKKRFNAAFWMPDLAFIAMGLDKDGRQIKSISSNPLHCLRAGIIDDAFVRQTVDRLFRDDLYSGWGVRTLSTRHIAFNPYSYQRGSVWPFEQGALALGLRRYRLYARLDRLVRAQFELATLFENNRLPEVFGGQPRDGEHPFPAMYPRANWPQAWSAAAIPALIESFLGLQPDAPGNELIVDPHLPEYVPELRLKNLRIGDAAADITFRRSADGHTDFVIERRSGVLKISAAD